MSMTAAEAEKKWCPWLRSRESEFGASSSITDMTPNMCHCLGPDCMMWVVDEGDKGDCGLKVPVK